MSVTPVLSVEIDKGGYEWVSSVAGRTCNKEKKKKLVPSLNAYVIAYICIFLGICICAYVYKGTHT